MHLALCSRQKCETAAISRKKKTISSFGNAGFSFLLGASIYRLPRDVNHPRIAKCIFRGLENASGHCLGLVNTKALSNPLQKKTFKTSLKEFKRCLLLPSVIPKLFSVF